MFFKLYFILHNKKILKTPTVITHKTYQSKINSLVNMFSWPHYDAMQLIQRR